MTLSALIVGAIAVAVRGSSDEGEGDAISGPAAGLPAVVGAAEELIGTVPPADSVAAELGRRYGEITVALAEGGDEVDFAAEFDRLPDAEARLAGRTLGEIQSELSPTAVDGSRGDTDRAPDIVFALEMARAAVQTTDPDASAARPGARRAAVRRARSRRLRRDRRHVGVRRPRRAGHAASTPANPVRRGRAAR